MVASFDLGQVMPQKINILWLKFQVFDKKT